jgi:predicted phage tail component-like protein
MDEMVNNTFLYNGKNLYELAFLRVFSYNVFAAELRARKVQVPGRSGAYDFGAEFHEERPLRMECFIERKIQEYQFDELKYALSRKGRIIMWDQPDRYYIGQAYNAAEVLRHWQYLATSFTLEFTCEPYAYSLAPTILTSALPVIFTEYEGTRKAPTRITIRNTGNASLSGVTITSREVA